MCGYQVACGSIRLQRVREKRFPQVFSDEGGEHTILYVRGLHAFHRRAGFMRARAEQRLTIPCTVGGLRADHVIGVWLQRACMLGKG